MAGESREVAIVPPKLSCTREESEQVMKELGLDKMQRTMDAADLVQRPITTNDLERLGAFVEGSSIIRLDHGAILITRQVMLRQLLRLEAKAQLLTELNDLKDITLAIGFLGAHIGKLSMTGVKARIVEEEVKEELRKKKQPFPAGVPVTAMQVHGDVHVHGNGVAAT